MLNFLNQVACTLFTCFSLLWGDEGLIPFREHRACALGTYCNCTVLLYQGSVKVFYLFYVVCIDWIL